MSYTTQDSKGTKVSISAQAKNHLLNVFAEVDRIAASEKWEAFWLEKYKVALPGEFDSNRKLLWIDEESRWCYTDISTVMIYPSNKHVEALLGEAIDQVKAALKKRVTFLETLSPIRARELLELFNCFEFV